MENINFDEINISDPTNLKKLLTIGLQYKSHPPEGPSYSGFNKHLGVINYEDKNDLKAIYHFTESHSPSLRVQNSFQYGMNCPNAEKCVKSLDNKFTDFQCVIDSNIDNMLKIVREMPKEWTLIQLTAVDIKNSLLPYEKLKDITPDVYLSRFDCGQVERDPVCVELVQSPSLTNASQLAKIMNDVLDNFSTEKKTIELVDLQIQHVIELIQSGWLRFWNILFFGKLVNSQEAEKKIIVPINKILSSSKETLNSKQISLIHCLALNCVNVSLPDLLQQILPRKSSIFTPLLDKIIALRDANLSLLQGRRYPVILIVDQFLDMYPWEGCKFFKNQTMSRLPSIHFVYALFKEYEHNIVNGFVTNFDSSKGAYVINPASDLPNMEKRMSPYCKKFLTNWSGTIGERISSKKFMDFLTNSDFFIYCGHGSGTQFLCGDDIKKLRLKGIVMLFGCESVKLKSLGGRSEFRGTHDSYLIACSPCVIGNLWKVYDYEMDLISAKLLSLLFPDKVSVAWDTVDKKQWREGKIVVDKNKSVKNTLLYTDEISQAVLYAKEEALTGINKYALITRGLPVKLNRNSS